MVLLELRRPREAHGTTAEHREFPPRLCRLSMTALLFIILYLYACIGVELITKNEVLKSDPDHGEAFQKIVDLYFTDMFVSFVRVADFLVRRVRLERTGQRIVSAKKSDS